VSNDVLTVFVAALLTAFATGLGALPFLLARHPVRSWLGLANGLAAGFMVGASGGLLWEGWRFSPARVVAGAAAGVLFIALAQRLLGDGREVHFGAFTGTDATKMLLIVGVMTVHSFTEGIGVGVSFGGGETLGLVIALAIAVHNIPEGLAISLVLVPRGVSVGRAAAWSVFSSLPQPLMAVPAFVFVEAFGPLLPFGLGFAAGAMLWMVATELLPEAVREAPVRNVAAVGLASAGAMAVLQAALL
jgi:zinc transporter, ZIP family